MKYNEFEGKKISEIGMGCYALGGAYGPVDKENYRDVLSYAREQGVNLFDTAETYGEDAERILGEVIGPSRDEVFISTKVGLKEGNRPSLSYQDVIDSCERSLERLGTDHIDLYLVHFDDPNTPVSETVEAFEELKENGKIEHYGVSHLSTEKIKRYIDEGDVSTCLLELSPVARDSRKELIPLLNENDIPYLAFSVTGRGILTGKYEERPRFDPSDIRNVDPMFRKARFDSAMRITDKLDEVGDRYGKTPVQVAIRWVLSQEGVLSALTGPSKKEHLEENLGGSGWELDKDGLEEIDAFLGKEEEHLNQVEPKLIEDILTSDLADEKEQVVNDLVYVIEVSITRGIVEEASVVPMIQKLLSMRSDLEKVDISRFEEIKEELGDLIL